MTSTNRNRQNLSLNYALCNKKSLTLRLQNLKRFLGNKQDMLEEFAILSSKTIGRLGQGHTNFFVLQTY